MPVNKKFKRNSATSTCQKSQAKAPGTRLGTFQDWRGDFGKAGKTGSERRNAFRDGR
jgi:hypothetical protein